MEARKVISKLRSMANPRNVEGMARFGINTENALGISVTSLRKYAKTIGTDHALALELWDSGIHEARILAAIVDDPSEVTEEQMEHWVRDFDSWDVCDQACTSLFDRTPFAFSKAAEWSHREEEFVKRAGFAMMAGLAAHHKSAPDEMFVVLLEHVKRESTDDRKYVKKAVNWALRGIGKRNLHLNAMAIEAAAQISEIDSRPARWIASDALRELSSEAVRKRLESRLPGARPGRRPSS
ncbi:TPA: DNA alkylation repair protein [Thermoplasmata archaeon]|nr:DNA alkylation repair protein [Thermoplasmata archaeon]